jgi:hypothetical protein
VTFSEGDGLVASYGDGRLTLRGSTLLDGLLPEAIDLEIVAANIDYAVSDEVRLRFSTQLDARGEGIDARDASAVLLSGDLAIIEGTYTTGSAVGSQLFEGTTGQRKVGAYSAPLVESAPWIGPTRLDVAVKSSNFQVRLGLPVGDVDIELRLDMKLEGTVADPELYGRIDLLPGGLISNTVIGREFELDKGSIDFSGDPKSPRVDVSLRSEVTFQETRTTDSFLGTSQIFSSFAGAGSDERTVVVSVTLTGQVDYDAVGREFEDIEVDLSSDAGYERSELITLLATGLPPGQGDSEASEGGGTVSLFADEVASVLAQTLLGVIIDDVKVGVGLQGSLDWQLRKTFGRNLRVSVAGSQGTTGQRVQPRFEFRISEHLSLEGSLRYQEAEQSSGQTYEAKLRYRIPLD